MKLLALAFLVIFSFAAALAKIETEDAVLVLTKDNFKEAIEQNEYLLVEFYAPWCGHCKALAPEYAKAAKKLQEAGSSVKLAKVDATVETELAEEHQLEGYPTLKFYRKGSVIDYTGNRQADNIVMWVTKKSGSAVKTLTTVKETVAFIESYDVVIIGFFKDVNSEPAKVFLEVGNANDDHVFGISSSEEIFNENKAEDRKVILFKKFDEGENEFNDEFDFMKLQNFIFVHSLPLVVDFNQDSAQKIFSGNIKSHFLLFLSKEAGHYDEYVEKLKEPAKKFRGEVIFVTINVDEFDHERILEFFGIKKEEVPVMRIIKFEQKMPKYKPEKPEITSENILEFITAYVEGKLKTHLFLQDLPEDWDKYPVKVLVSSNFHEVAHDKEKNVVIDFYAPWCEHCQNLVPIYEALGEKYKDKEDIVIAKMDAVANELEDLTIQNFPTIMLYKKETNEAVQYNGERTLEGLSKFIDTNGAYGEAAKETQEEDEDDDVPRKDEL
ncbi:protein disulfide-isomerase isoform X1 [Colletes gigas]|uniref:protein disulfide-isomerase isoform X1 n=1 Tax=Colletes gigas TaxID=935657 RepID=UPI001C9B933A|nr:protein disulfide-isomerase isoform X1 [Colletes gigas]